MNNLAGMKTILVTGSNGLLGQKITEAVLSGQPFNLVATGKGLNRFKETEGYQYAEMDITDAAQVQAVLEKFKPDAVIHTAALTNVDKCQADHELAARLNVDAVKILADICALHDIQLVHLSTDFIFDGAAGPYDESSVPNPLSYYGSTKLEAENIVRASAGRWAILRTILVYGVISDKNRSNIVLWAKNALEKGDAIKVVNDQWRMPTLADDLAACCLLAVQKDATGIFNVSGKDMMSVSEVVYRVASFWKLDRGLITEVSSDSLNESDRRPARTGFVIDKAVNTLGYSPRSFEEGLALVDLQLKGRDEKKEGITNN
jgi:dTDP-4-dehydrorhamnose reductase